MGLFIIENLFIKLCIWKNFLTEQVSDLTVADFFGPFLDVRVSSIEIWTNNIILENQQQFITGSGTWGSRERLTLVQLFIGVPRKSLRASTSK